jgi:hypothetical protein
MVLVDTSIWIDHLRIGEPRLAELLREDQVLIHPLIIEEIACGRLMNRRELFELLENLPKTPQADHAEILGFLENQRLAGCGIGAVDAHLLASARLAQAPLWTRDKNLGKAAKKLNLLYETGGSAKGPPR